MSENLFGSATPALGDEADGSTNYALGVRFTSAVNGVVSAISWFFPATIPDASVPVQAGLFEVAGGTLLGSASFPLGATLGAKNTVGITGGNVTAGLTYAAAIWTPLRYVATSTYPFPVTSGNLTAGASNGWLTANPGTLVLPSSVSGNNANFFVDIVFDATVEAQGVGTGPRPIMMLPRRRSQMW